MVFVGGRLSLAMMMCCGAAVGQDSSEARTCSLEKKQNLHPMWYDVGGEIQNTMRDGGHYRKGDIIISVPGKSGTTWTMNIVHQIRSGGDPDLRDVYEQVPWLEFWEDPNQSTEELVRKFGAMPTWFPRAFKSHSAIGQNNLDYNKDLKYITVMRNPTDAAESFPDFMKAHNEAFVEFYNASAMLSEFSLGDTEKAWSSFFLREGNSSIEFLQSFWEHRHKENVLVLHYTDMRADHIGTIRKIATFLGYDHPTSKFDKICEYTSFAWMKKHGEKFSVQHLCKLPVLTIDGMVRKGGVGNGKKALSANTLKAFDLKLSKVLTKEQATWLMNGGDLALQKCDDVKQEA